MANFVTNEIMARLVIRNARVRVARFGEITDNAKTSITDEINRVILIWNNNARYIGECGERVDEALVLENGLTQSRHHDTN